MQLKHLTPGSHFTHNNTLFKVTGKLKVMWWFGSSTRECKNLETGKTVRKSGRLEVTKVYICRSCGGLAGKGKISCVECEWGID